MPKNKYEKYRKKENCNYPFKPERLGYCWTWAKEIDGDFAHDETRGRLTNECYEKIVCRQCEYYTGKYAKSKKD